MNHKHIARFEMRPKLVCNGAIYGIIKFPILKGQHRLSLPVDQVVQALGELEELRSLGFHHHPMGSDTQFV
jgi:hypothetical protein